jgi:hypothetical protein
LSYAVLAHKVDKVADFNLGALVTKFRRHKNPEKNEHTLLYSTTEGNLGFLVSYDSKYGKLITLQNLLSIEFPFLAGLHPKDYR